jgi:hypothetical protein
MGMVIRCRTLLGTLLTTATLPAAPGELAIGGRVGTYYGVPVARGMYDPWSSCTPPYRCRDPVRLRLELQRHRRTQKLRERATPEPRIYGPGDGIWGLQLGVKLQVVDVRSSEELADAYAALAKDRPQALVVLADRVFLHNRSSIVDFALKNRLPTAVTHQELVDSGGLMSFGANYPDMHRRAAIYVDKILKGNKPGDIPIEQPTKFELVINVKTAKALALTIPVSLMLRADRLIQ